MKNSREQEPANALHARTDEELAQLRPVSGAYLCWLPGESLYSLIARNHYYRGHQLPAHTVHAFFGTLSGNSLQQDMTEMGVFVARTEGSLGTAQEVLEERTLLRFYRLFEEGSVERFLAPDRHTSDSILKYPLGLRTGRFRSKHPLKGCPICLREDEKNIGLQYWRLTHQFPGVWVCLEHDHGLQEIILKPTPQQKFLWQTPREERLRPVPLALSDGKAFSRFRAMSQLIISITSEKEQGLRRLGQAREVLCTYLHASGQILASGRLRRGYKNHVTDLCASFVEFAHVLRGHVEFANLPGNADSAFRLLEGVKNFV